MVLEYITALVEQGLSAVMENVTRRVWVLGQVR